MSDIREQLLQAQQSGQLLAAIGRLTLGVDAKHDELSGQLIDLHNAGEIDVVEAFSHLHNSTGPDFFLTRHRFDKVLPALSATTRSVMLCCAHLTAQSGQDMTAGSSLAAFGDFLAKSVERAREALQEIEADPVTFTVLLVVTLVAGSRSDLPFFLEQALRLMSHPDPAVRASVWHAVGRLAWTPDVSTPASMLAALDQVSRNEADDRVLASALKSTALLWTRESTNEALWAPIVRALLERGGPFTIHASAELLGFEIEHAPIGLSDLLLGAMHGVSTENGGTIKILDFGLSHMLQRGAGERVLEFLEIFLVARVGAIEIRAFPTMVAQVQRDPALVAKLLTRWLSGGKRALGTAVHLIVSGLHEGPSTLRIDPTEIDVSDRLLMVFIARKAIGHLLLEPQHCVAIIVSQMSVSGDVELCKELAELLYDVVLVNFSGSGRDAIVRAIESADPTVKNALTGALQRLDAYLQALPDPLPALQPSQRHREAARRRMADQVRSSIREAEKKSVFLSILKRSVLLYGRSSIHYVDAPDAPRRVAMPLHRHGTSIEVPRLSVLDPLGLDHGRRVFISEQRVG